jgi:hypothetical protein
VAEAPYSNLSSVSQETQTALGMCLLAGSSMMLFGTTLGLRIGPVCIARRIHTHLLSPLLGDDIRVSYTLAWCGLLSTGAAMWFYIANTPYQRLLGTLGGILSIVVGCMCVTLGPMFLMRAHHYNKTRSKLLDEIVSGEQ